MSMNWSAAASSWAAKSLAVWLLALARTTAVAQQSNEEATPQVQQLYAQAKAAQQQGDRATAIKKYRAMITLAPHLAAAYNNLGVLYFKELDYAQAAEAFQRTLELDPKMQNVSALLGTTYFQLGAHEKAAPLLQAALNANPTDDNVEMMLALTLINLKKFEEGVSHLSRSLERNPKNQDGWYLLRKTYLQMSEDALARINQINPDSAIAHQIAGEIKEAMRDYAGALVEYKKAVDRAPQQPGTHQHLADVYWHLGKWESAQAEFKSELANDQNDCTARWRLADAMLEANGSTEDAVAELNRSITLCPNLMPARVDRARGLIRLGRPEDALPDLLLAAKDSPTEPTVHFLLASVYKAQGKTTDAQQELQTFDRLKREAMEGAGKQANEAAAIP